MSTNHERTNIALVDATSSSLTVSWPEIPGATAYILQYRRVGGDDQFETLSDHLTTTQVRKRNLIDQAEKGFYFRVAASPGTREDPSAWITHDKAFCLLKENEDRTRMPSPNVSLAGKNETLLVSWTKQLGSTNASEAYELQMRENGPGCQWRTIAESLSGTEVRKKNLSSNNGYHFRVRCTSSDSDAFSPPSDPVVALGLSQGVKTLFRTLEDGSLLRHGSDSPLPLADALGGKEFILLYASAHWCPPCRKFTPVLAQWYESLGPNKTVEVVFLSADRDERGFRDYYKQMPWLSVPYDDDAREQLMAHIRVSGIPRLVVVDGRSGRMLVDNAVGQSLDVARWRLLASSQK